ncbi:MAG: phosphoribosylaminoimidazolesuccinocarboxamide synthase [Saprospiraceae bacterium]
MEVDAHCISETRFSFPGQTGFYRGKVREVYTIGNQLVMVATDRISAFDHILPRPIPWKGQVLNLLAAHFLKATSDVVPNWLEAVPHPNVSIGKACTPFPIEMVIRGYLTGHAWRIYRDGGRVLCGQELPEGMKEHDRFPEPIITPATKAESGHDEDITPEEIIRRGLATEEEYLELETYTRALYRMGTDMASERGLILVDTKYEFGRHDGEILLIDEVHTPDSSRYFYQDGYEALQAAGMPQQQLSKEFVREWLMAHGFQGLEGQVMPDMPDEFVEQVSMRYRALYELLTGATFPKTSDPDLPGTIEAAVVDWLSQ